MTGVTTTVDWTRTAIPLSAEARAEVVRGYLALLAEHRSPLLNDAVATVQVRQQIDAVLDVVALGAPESPWGHHGRAAATGQAAGLDARIGVDRASAGIRPSDSLLAAGLIFQAALPVLSRELAAGGHATPELSAALALNWALSVRMSQAAAAYVEYLLARVHRAQSEERRRIARELHDRVAHSVGVGTQYLELFRHEIRHDERLAGRLAEVRTQLTEAVNATRMLSADLRDPLDAQDLQTAVQAYLRANCPPGIEATLSVQSPIAVLPDAYAQEIYLALREAVRNAFLHSGTPTVRVQLSAPPGLLCAEVRDCGTGFDVDKVLGTAGSNTVGLRSMRERIELCGGVFEVISVADRGTTVCMTVPIPEPAG